MPERATWWGSDERAVLFHRPGAGRVRPRTSRQGRHIARVLSLRWACDVIEGISRKSGIPKSPTVDRALARPPIGFVPIRGWAGRGAARGHRACQLRRESLRCGAMIKVRSRIASPGNVPETSSFASPSVLPLPHCPPAEPQLLFRFVKSMLTDVGPVELWATR
jgi:hypothetical protein